MTDQNVPDVTDNDRRLAREWAEFIESDMTGLSSRRKRSAARVILNAAPAPALPDGWRLADHSAYGRVIVTNPTPNPSGRVYFVLPSADPMGYDWFFCTPDRLTYLDQGDDTDDTERNRND